MEKIFIIAGPTGVGKSDFAELLAERIDGEIINADQGQLYAPLSIGTAKPAWQSKPSKHHLFDIIQEPRHYSNAAYQRAVKECVAYVHARGKRAIVVGGSAFYYQMLLFDFLPLPALDCQPGEHKKGGSWQELHSIDPERAAAIHPNDQYRIERALEIFYTHKVLPSSVGLIYRPSFSYQLVHINRSVEDLHERINKRTHEMLSAGWLQEVERLTPAWQEFVQLKKIIGYDDIVAFQKGCGDYVALVASIQKKTRAYAKRQKTFFRSLVKKIPHYDQHRIYDINLTLSSGDLYLNQLVELITRNV